MVTETHKVITVYCASSAAVDRRYLQAAEELGRLTAERGITLVTGGGATGLMGAVNDAALSAGGRTIGVIPRFMVDRGWHHKGLGELKICDSMHSRKQLMASLCRAAIALPGGVGTLEELLEIITWRQLGLYDGKIVIMNVDGYYDALIAMLDKAIEERFLNEDHRTLWTVATNARQALDQALSDNTKSEFSSKIQKSDN